jgi:tRNA threonylcarbamoyladenosine biosynthesis protein TsaB
MLPWGNDVRSHSRSLPASLPTHAEANHRGSRSMRILAADTSTPYLAVALREGTRVLAETVVYADRKHSERLLTTVDWVLQEAGAALSDVDALAVAIGPGSFTGLRVGVSAFKGLALAAVLPLVPVPTLDAMARLLPEREGTLCPMLDAKMGEVFAAAYRYDGCERVTLRPARACSVEDALDGLDGPVTVFGDALQRYAARILDALPHAVLIPFLYDSPRASAVAAEAEQLLSRGLPADPSAVSPVYLRGSQAEENRAKATAT